MLISGCMNSYASFMMNMGGVLFGVLFYLFMKHFCSMKYEYDPRRRRLLSENETEDSSIEKCERLLPEIAEEPVNETIEHNVVEEGVEVNPGKTDTVESFVATNSSRNESSPLLNHLSVPRTGSPAYGTRF